MNELIVQNFVDYGDMYNVACGLKTCETYKSQFKAGCISQKQQGLYKYMGVAQKERKKGNQCK